MDSLCLGNTHASDSTVSMPVTVTADFCTELRSAALTRNVHDADDASKGAAVIL